MRPLFHQDSRESLGTSSRETSVFSFCHLTLDDSLSTLSRVIDEQTTGMAKRDAPRVPKKCQMREELYLKISWVENTKEKIYSYCLQFSRFVENYIYLTKFHACIYKSKSITWKWFLWHFDTHSEIKWMNESNIRTCMYISLLSCNVIRASKKYIYKYSQLSCQTHNDYIANKIKYHVYDTINAFIQASFKINIYKEHYTSLFYLF